ncbi:MAG TPA: ferritin [Bacteroidales bacterium]|nr:ferritin [Bacteroidales bacterium]
MLNKKVEDILNVQVEKEDYSSQLYLAMASWAENQGFSGVANWLYAQSDEERLHMLKIIKYINERDGVALIPGMKQPPKDFDNMNEMFKAVLEHEQYITDSINEIVAVCIEEKDYTTHNWVQWFVEEQIEEEASAKDIIDKLNLVGERNLYMFDRDIMSMRGASEEEE